MKYEENLTAHNISNKWPTNGIKRLFRDINSRIYTLCYATNALVFDIN